LSRDTPDNTGSFDTLFVVYEWACPNHIIALFYLSRRPYHRSHAQTRSVPRTGLPAKALALPFVISYKHHGKSVRVRESLRCCWMLPKMTIHPVYHPTNRITINILWHPLALSCQYCHPHNWPAPRATCKYFNTLRNNPGLRRVVSHDSIAILYAARRIRTA